MEQFELNEKLAKLHDLPEATYSSPKFIERDVRHIKANIIVNMESPQEMVTETISRFVFEKKLYRIWVKYGYKHIYQYELIG